MESYRLDSNAGCDTHHVCGFAKPLFLYLYSWGVIPTCGKPVKIVVMNSGVCSFIRGSESVQKWIVVMVAGLCGNIKTYWNGHFKWVNCTVIYIKKLNINLPYENNLPLWPNSSTPRYIHKSNKNICLQNIFECS